MNTNSVVSLPAAADLTGKEYSVVGLTSTGVDLADAGDQIIGTLVRAQPHQEDGSYTGKAVAVQLKREGIHFAILGATSAAIASGAGLILDSGNDGALIPSESSPIAIAVDAHTGVIGGIIRVYFL